MASFVAFLAGRYFLIGEHYTFIRRVTHVRSVQVRLSTELVKRKQRIEIARPIEIRDIESRSEVVFRVPGTRVPAPSWDRTDSKSKLKAERAGINQFRASNRIRVLRAQVGKEERERERTKEEDIYRRNPLVIEKYIYYTEQTPVRVNFVNDRDLKLDMPQIIIRELYISYIKCKMIIQIFNQRKYFPFNSHRYCVISSYTILLSLEQSLPISLFNRQLSSKLKEKKRARPLYNSFSVPKKKKKKRQRFLDGKEGVEGKGKRNGENTRATRFATLDWLCTG